MIKRLIVIAAVVIMSALLIVGCGCSKKGLYSSEVAAECYNTHRSELEAAAQSMIDYQNIWMVLRGKHRDFTDRRFTYIDGFSVFTIEPITEAEIKTIKESILPAFADERLESVRRMPFGYAEYASFFYQSSLFDNIYLLLKEICRTEDGALIDESYITDWVDLGDSWCCIRYSS